MKWARFGMIADLDCYLHQTVIRVPVLVLDRASWVKLVLDIINLIGLFFHFGYQQEIRKSVCNSHGQQAQRYLPSSYISCQHLVQMGG